MLRDMTTPRTPPPPGMITVYLYYHISRNKVREPQTMEYEALPGYLTEIGNNPFGHQAFPTEGVIMHFALAHGDKDYFVPGSRILELIHGAANHQLHLVAVVREVPKCDYCPRTDPHLPFQSCRFCHGFQVWHHGGCCPRRPGNPRRRPHTAMSSDAPGDGSLQDDT